MIGYTVAVRHANWPTMQELQACIDSHGWPVRLGRKDHPEWTEALAAAPQTLGIPAVFKGEPIELEAVFITLETDKTLAFNERLASTGACVAPFEAGDRILTLVFRVNLKEYQAGFYVLAALMKGFDGYGLYGHYLHGTPIDAETLLAEAADAAEREARPPPPITNDEILRFSREVLEALRKAKRMGEP